MKRLLSLLLLMVSISACGHQGAQGVPGPAGSPGPQGSPGPSGTSIVSTTVVATADQCPNGGNVLLIAQDTLGTGVWNVADKDQSSILVCNGTNGTSSTTLSVVQFCSNYSPSYPSTFPEFGLCINEEVYGVYWDGSNAWLSILPNGEYDSTSSSAPCTFTIGDNCSITQN